MYSWSRRLSILIENVRFRVWEALEWINKGVGPEPSSIKFGRELHSDIRYFGTSGGLRVFVCIVFLSSLGGKWTRLNSPRPSGLKRTVRTLRRKRQTFSLARSSSPRLEQVNFNSRTFIEYRMTTTTQGLSDRWPRQPTFLQ